MAGQKFKTRAANSAIFVALLIGAVIMITPLLWMFLTSIRTDSLGEFSLFPGIENISFKKYSEVFIYNDFAFLKALSNTVIIEILVLSVGTFTSSLAAFAFSKLRFRHKSGMFMCLLATMMIPFPIVMIPQYIIFSNVGWVGTLLPMIIPSLFGNVSMIFFLRQNFSSIPDSLLEAAKIDGCGYFRMYLRICLPLMKAAISTQVILWFMFIWNDYLGPLIFLGFSGVETLQLFIASFKAMQSINTDYPLFMSAATLAMLPTLILFFLFQRFIIQSVAVSGIKE